MKSKKLDILGISAATLCLIHCLVFPMLMIVPLGIAHNAYIDLAFLTIGLLIVFRITRNMNLGILKSLFWSGIGLIGISIFLDLLFHYHSPLIYIGTTTLVIAHVLHFNSHKEA